MKPNYPTRCISLLVLASAVLNAQAVRQENAVPLKNWATPLYWQPDQTEKGAPQLQFSSNAVSSSALTFVAITPCRLVDTRGAAANFNGMSPFSGPSIPAAGTITIPVQSATEASADTEPAPCGTIPSIAQAYSLNLTVVPVAGGAVDYISMWPSGYTKPFVATLNDPQGAVVANAAIVPAGTVSGGISVYNQGPATANVIIDMNGYFTAPTDLSGNTAVGSGTLASNTTGFENTASGSGALQNNTTGNNNTATGAGAMFNNTTGCCNTATGVVTLAANTTGNYNTASGEQALQLNTTGSQNTATGYSALASNTTGSGNTASGYEALNANTTGFANTANGFQALQANTTGQDNTASGESALASNTTGSGNTATGEGALASNATGFANTASGYSALVDNTNGAFNTATGASALQNNTTGSFNTASGVNAQQNNATGAQNTAIGWGALQANTTGTNNVAIGFEAASGVAAGNGNNIHVGSEGSSGDNATIRIGIVGVQTSAYIAGISGATPGTPNFLVCVDGNGQLGTVGCSGSPSSQRFKEQIQDMGDSSSALLQLRPVTFLYKPEYDDGSHTLQYGLIAEEVAKLYPEMVGYDKEGRPASVKYQSLAPMLLNEMQKQLQKQQEENRRLEDRLAALEAQLASLRPAGLGQ